MFKYTLKHIKTYILTDFEFPWGFVLFNSPISHTHIMRTTWLARPGNTGLIHLFHVGTFNFRAKYLHVSEGGLQKLIAW